MLLSLTMPSGTLIEAEAYAEFGHALKVLQDTKAFAAEIEAKAADPGKALVFLEGETDPTYLTTAAEVLDRAALLESVEFEWIGTKGAKGGEQTGKDALNAALAFLRRKTHIFQRKLILLYDYDARKPHADYDGNRLHVRTMHFNLKNTRRTVGIENLLPPDVISEDMYSHVTHHKGNTSAS
jgi:hypothetical protein